MNLTLSNRISRAAAFTMTEIALCIAVIGVALVAIIGVLPSGLNVQKQNREDSLVAQDAQFLIESIRSGSLGIYDLTNNVDYIWWHRSGGETSDEYFRGPNYTDPLPGNVIPITDSWQVLALLSLPHFESKVVGRKVIIIQNDITAQFRSLSGPFSEKSYRDGPGSRPDQSRFASAFRYQLTMESGSAVTRPPSILLSYPDPVSFNIVSNTQVRMEESLSDVRLTFHWPVYKVGDNFRVGGNRRSFRTEIFGNRQVLTTNFLGTGRLVSRFNGSPAITNLVRF